MSVGDYSTTPALNVSIGGTNINEGCSPGGVNNAIRTLMADVRVMYDGLPSTATFQTKVAAVFSGTQPIYTGRGAYTHWNSASLTSGRRFMQAAGGATPAGMLAGDELLEY